MMEFKKHMDSAFRNMIQVWVVIYWVESGDEFDDSVESLSTQDIL